MKENFLPSGVHGTTLWYMSQSVSNLSTAGLHFEKRLSTVSKISMSYSVWRKKDALQTLEFKNV